MVDHDSSQRLPTTRNTLWQTVNEVIYPRIMEWLRTLWSHPAGPKTIFFWAPAIKWCLVLAGISDIARPADKLSFYQNVALFATGAIWTRYSFAIRPINYSLASVNFFLCTVALVQLARIFCFEVFGDSEIQGTESLLNQTLVEEQLSTPQSTTFNQSMPIT